MKPRNKGRLGPFVPLLKDTMKTEAWKALSHGARSLYVALRARYNSRLQNAVYLSIRVAHKELGSFSDIDNVGRWFRELQYYGFIVMESGPCLGVEGKGKAPHWRLIEEWYLDRKPTRDYLNWDGEVFQEQKPPSYYNSNRQRKFISPKKQNPVPPVRYTAYRPSGTVSVPKSVDEHKSVPPVQDIQQQIGVPPVQDITSLTTPCLSSDCSVEPTGAASSIVPDIAPNNLASEWTTPELTELEWNDHWFLVYLNKLKTGEGIISKVTARVT
jgi:hypothetical protein